jgi:hypothetical protein
MTPTATPTIEVREVPPTALPPETSVDEISVVEAVQGQWTASQAYDAEGERMWLTGTLTIEGTSYTFTRANEITGASVQGELDFLFETPNGGIVVNYPDGITPDDALESFASGDTLATCMLHTSSAAAHEFQIKMGEHNSLYFYNPSSEFGLWRVTKQLEDDAEQ